MRLQMKFPFFWSRRNTSQHDETRPLLLKGTRDLETKLFTSQEDSTTVTGGKLDSSGGKHGRNGLSRMPMWLPKQRPYSVSGCLLRYPLFLSNLLFSILGLVTLGLGMWGLVDKESFAQERIGHIGTDPMLLFVSLGLVLSLLCVTGCVGILRENICLLWAFSAMLLALVSFQVLAAIIVYNLQSQIKGYLRSVTLTAIARYQDDLDFRFIMDELQTGLQCCGADNLHDWEVNVYFNCSAPGVQACGVPASCCVDPLENGTVWNSQCGLRARQLDEFSAQSVVFLGGCLGGVARWVEQHVGTIGVVGAVVLGAQVLSVFATTRLLQDIRMRKVLWQRGPA